MTVAPVLAPTIMMAKDIDAIAAENAQLKADLEAMKATHIEMILDFQNTIDGPPFTPKQLYRAACAGDETTVESWLKIWKENAQKNHERFGRFQDFSLTKLHNTKPGQAAFCVGSGPSLKRNFHHLKDVKHAIIVSCLHNFGLFEDNDIFPDYYVTLDGGEIVLTDLYEGGSVKDPEHYWERTVGKILLASITSPPKLFEKWRGQVYLFNCPIPGDEWGYFIRKLEWLPAIVSSGGNVLGACTNIARVFLGCPTIIYAGADFAFGYNHKFYPWPSPQGDTLGQTIPAIDVYGNKVRSWVSYTNFKAWFDFVAVSQPGIWINATEGGTMGAYPEGNIKQVIQMKLADAVKMFSYHETPEFVEGIKGECMMEVDMGNGPEMVPGNQALLF